MGRQVVSVEFLSQSLQVYSDHQLALDIMTVGEGLHNLPIKAECVVPTVTPNTDLLDFEQCYLRSAADLSLTTQLQLRSSKLDHGIWKTLCLPVCYACASPWMLCSDVTIKIMLMAQALQVLSHQCLIGTLMAQDLQCLFVSSSLCNAQIFA